MRNMTRGIFFVLHDVCLGNNRSLIVLQFNAVCVVNYALIYSEPQTGELNLIPFKG